MRMVHHLIAAAAGVALAGSAQAVALGDTVTCTGTGFTCSSPSTTITSGTEFTLAFGGTTYFSANFGVDLLTLTFLPQGASTFNSGFGVSFRDTTNPITSASLLSASGTAFSSGALSLAGNGLSVNFVPLTFNPGSSVLISLSSLDAPAPSGSVPEPASWAMMVGGLGLIGATMRQRTARTVLA